MSSWIRGTFAVATLLLLVGCGTNEKDQKIRLQETKIRSLTSEVNLLGDKNRQVAHDRDLYKAKYETNVSVLASKDQQAKTLNDMLREKDAQIARERQLADKAMDARSKPPVVVVRGGGSTGGASGKTAARGGSKSGQGKYHLRIISLPKNSHNEKVAQQMASYLSSKGITDVVPRVSGSYWVIDIGHFHSIRSSEAVSLRNSVRNMRYKGIRQFRTAYFAQY